MKHSPTRSRSAAGFTIVEVMIAGALLVAGVMGSIQVLSSGAQMLDTARKQAVAMQIIDSEIEKLRATDATQLTSLFTAGTGETATPDQNDRTKLTYRTAAGGTSTAPTTFRAIDAVVPIDPSFAVLRTVAAVSGKTNFKQITYKVTWTGYNGRTLSRTGSTYIGKDGLNVSYRR